jgi:hypothetical protein
VTTASTIITRANRQLLSGTVEQRNKLAASINASTDTVTFSYDLEGIRQGQVFEIDSELFYVWAVSVGAKSATVERGFNGTTAAAHDANALVTVNPRFPRNQMLEALNDELADLSSPTNGLFKVTSLNLDYNGSDTMIDLTGTSNIQDILSVSVRYLTDDYIPVRKFRLMRDVPTDDFPTGVALRMDQAVLAGRLRIVYKSPFAALTAESQDVTTVGGVPASCDDILALGVQIRLMSPREIKRNFTESQGDTRRADEVPQGAVGNSMQALLRLRRDRITAEAMRLARQYPTLMTKA